jgi:UDP-N-acetylmuramate--alanine ligase
MAHCAGVPAESSIRTLESFSGTRRRFDIRHHGPLLLRGEMRDVMLIDDYAHHPTAIAATLAATRLRYPERRLVAIYQPHMYSRTKTFFAQFLEAFDEADIAIIADIFPARERDTGLIHARDLVEAMRPRTRFTSGSAELYHGGNIEQITSLLSEKLRSGDLVLLMGAGDIYTVTEQLLRNAGRA